MGCGKFLRPQNRHPVTDRRTICHRQLRRWPCTCAKFGENLSTRGFWTNGWNITVFSSLFTYKTYLFSATYLQVRPVDGFSRLMTQTTRNTQGCPFRDLVDIVPYLWGQSPQHPHFWGISRHFQAKLVKIKFATISKWQISSSRNAVSKY